MDIILNGTLTPHQNSFLATAPMEVANEIDRSNKYLQGGPRTARLPRVTVPVPGSVERAWTAYYPGRGIRGKLRRLATEVFYAQAQAAGWDVDELRYLMIGGVKGSDSAADYDLATAQKLRDRLPIIGLFGATSDLDQEWMAGRMAVQNAIPETPLQPPISSGVRTDDLGRDPGTVRYLSTDAAASLTARANAERKSTALRRALKDAEKALATAKRAKDADAQQEASARIEQTKADLEQLEHLVQSDVSVQMPLDGYEYIPGELPLQQGFSLRGANWAELGIFALALEAWAHDPYLGAHFAHGGGVVRGEWSVKGREGFGTPYRSLGQIVMTPFEGLVVEGELAQWFEKGTGHLKELTESYAGKSIREILSA